MPDNELQKNRCTTDIMQELIAAEYESIDTSERYEHDEVMEDLRAKIAASQKNK